MAVARAARLGRFMGSVLRGLWLRNPGTPITVRRNGGVTGERSLPTGVLSRQTRGRTLNMPIGLPAQITTLWGFRT